jgi:hypothetical protein
MTPVDKGRFCDSCAKKVVDFSILTDKEINERVRNASGNMCGRFRKDQLDKTFTLQPKIQLSTQRRFFQYLISILLASKSFVNKAIGQTDTIKTEQTDTLKSIAEEIDSTCIDDTVAIALADTLKINIDSINWVWINRAPTIIISSIPFLVDERYVYGGLGIVYKEPEPEFSLMLPIFEKVKSLVGIKSSVQKETFVAQNDNPIPRKEPIKKEAVISDAIMPEELKRKSEETI